MPRILGKKSVPWIIAILIIVGILVYFYIPYSPIKSRFNRQIDDLVSHTQPIEAVFTLDDIKHLPTPVRRYFEYSGFIGTPKSAYMRGNFTNADFSTSPDRKIKIDYTQYNFANPPRRLAFIDSAVMGIPFQGLDAYVDGLGTMQGEIAKIYPLFNITGGTMNKSSLVTMLSESLLFPSVALQSYMSWEAIDDTRARATITYAGISASGEFSFNEKGEMRSFTTNDRTYTTLEGVSQEARWSIFLGDYTLVNGIRHPQSAHAVWHLGDGDFVYFKSDNTKIEYFK